MITRVVDASVACKWFFEESHTPEARQIIARGDQLISPDLVLNECANVAIRHVLSNRSDLEQARELITLLPNTFDSLVPCSELMFPAMDMAYALRHPIYDCLYLALAERERAEMVTADSEFVRKVDRSRWKQFITHLGKL